MFCSQCGTELAADSVFCSKCGKPIPTQSQISAPSSVDSALPQARPLNPAPQPRKLMSEMKRYIMKARNGEERLWIVFWLYNVLGIFLFRILFALLDIVLTEKNARMGMLIFACVFVVLVIVYFIWALASLWKCAFNVGWKGWGYLGRAYVVWCVFSFFGSLLFILWNAYK